MASQQSPMKVKNYNPDELGFFNRHLIVPMKRYLGLCEKEIRTLLKDKAAMFITFAIPIVVILALTIGADQSLLTESSSGVEQSDDTESTTAMEVPDLAILDLDTSEGFPDRDLSQELMDKFNEQERLGNCRLHQTTNESELEMQLGIGKLSAFLVIPQMFEANLSIHFPVILRFVLDSIDTMALTNAQSVVEGVIQDFRIENNFTGVFKVEKHNVNLPEQSQTYFAAAPIFIPMILFGIGCLASTQAIVSDIPKDRMVLTPTNKREMMAAKVTGNTIVMTLLCFVIIGTSAAVQLQIRASWPEFFLITLIIALNSVLIGVAISAVSNTPLSAFQYFIFMFLFQVVILLFVEDPTILNLLPIYNGNKLILNVVLRGQSLWSVRMNVFYIFLESFGIYMFAYFVFKAQKTML